MTIKTKKFIKAYYMFHKYTCIYGQTQSEQHREKALDASLELTRILNRIALGQYVLGNNNYNLARVLHVSTRQIDRIARWAEKAGRDAVIAYHIL